MTAAMTDHIQNNPFGRSTDGHKDDWSAVQIGGSARIQQDTTHLGIGMVTDARAA